MEKDQAQNQQSEKLFKKRDLIWIIGGVVAVIFIVSQFVPFGTPAISKEEAIQYAADTQQVKEFLEKHPGTVPFAMEQECAASNCAFDNTKWLVNYENNGEYVDVFISPTGSVVAVKP